MYNMDTEEGQMMSFLWNMLEEGEYRDAEVLANQILADNPLNKDAITVLAIVNEKMADASRDGGDEEGEVKFLKASLSYYLKILSADPMSVAEKIKVAKIRKRLNEESSELDNEFINNRWLEIKEKINDFYYSRLAKYPIKKILKIAIAVLPVIILASVGFGIYNHIHKSDNETVTAEDLSVSSESVNEETVYTGPVSTIRIENQNAREERLEEEAEKNYREKVAQEAENEKMKLQDGGYATNRTRKTPLREDAYQSAFNYSDYGSKQKNQQVKPFKLPFSDIELKESENKDGEENTEKTENTSDKEKKEENVSENTKTEVTAESRNYYNGSASVKRADTLIGKAVKAHDAGDKETARRLAEEAKTIYSSEINSGNRSSRVKSNIKVADTILGNR